MAIKKRTDQLPAILSGDVDNNDLMYLVHENAQAETGYDSKKILVSDVGRKLNNGVEYATELPSFPPGEQNPLDALEYLNSKINDLYPVDSASGSIANFTTSLVLPLVALKTAITAQGGGGTPETPVAITGFNSVTITCADGEMQTVDTFTLPLGQTVYGGYVDWGNGKLVVTHLAIPFISQDLTWTYQSGNTRFYTGSLANVIKKASASTVIPEGFNCECYNPHTFSGMGELDISIATSGNIFVKDTNYTDVTNWLNAIGNQKFVYPLATPLEISLPTTMPQTIEGEQNWFADSGDIELSYKMDIQEYIDKKIAEVQALVL